jgi:leucyl-tRNA synthetase
LRNTGKDLVQNHMTFCLFAHAAIFPKELWPRGYGVNGWVRLAGRKMSKSKGNVWYIRDAVREWGADPIRMAVANAGDGLDDPNVDLDFAAAATVRLRDWFRFATARHASRKERHGIDAWFLSVLNRAIQATRASMQEMNYKTALRHGYFDIQSAWSWYLRRSEGRPRAEILRRFIEVQTKLLAPFAPHACEEIWHRIDGDGFVVGTSYPVAVVAEIDPRAEAAESLLQATLADVREILKVTRIQPKRIALYTAADWKVRVYGIAIGLAKEGPIRMNVLIERALAEPGMRERAQEVAAYAKRLGEDLQHTKPDELGRTGFVEEFAMFRENAHFLTKELRVKVDVFRADDSQRWDPAKKADHAVPGRPAIYVE